MLRLKIKWDPRKKETIIKVRRSTLTRQPSTKNKGRRVQGGREGGVYRSLSQRNKRKTVGSRGRTKVECKFTLQTKTFIVFELRFSDFSVT